MKSVIISVPHRISGFFQIVDSIDGVKIKDPQKIGSRGAGFNLSAKGITKIILDNKTSPKNDTRVQIFINGQELNKEAETSYYILENMTKELLKKTYPYHIRVEHKFELPVGCGYGTSGSGALGLAYGLNKILELRLPQTTLDKIAHVAEVINQTGLGTVCGQLAGGLSMLLEPGHPCKYENIDYPHGIRVICATFGDLHTKSVLSDPVMQKKIKKAGGNALKRLRKNPSLQNFMKNSINFVKKTKMLKLLDLMEIKELIDGLNSLDIIGASMNQLGRSVYAICKGSNQEKVIRTFKSFKPEAKIYNLTINKSGPKFLK
ncbi:MAG: pantoate kinase [Promethearchaeia archaeon]